MTNVSPQQWQVNFGPNIRTQPACFLILFCFVGGLDAQRSVVIMGRYTHHQTIDYCHPHSLQGFLHLEVARTASLDVV